MEGNWPDHVASYDQAHAAALEALRISDGFFLIAIDDTNEKETEFAVHVGAHITRQQLTMFAEVVLTAAGRFERMIGDDISE